MKVFYLSNNKFPGSIASSLQTVKMCEAFSYLKGPRDMLQLYEQKYQTEIKKFAIEQTGRRRRDDYTDGAVRMPIQSAVQ